MYRTRQSRSFGLCIIGLFVLALAYTAFGQGKNPVILIPGLSGSELRHKDTNERIWFRALKPKAGDLRLPVIADFRNSRDELISGDIIREVKIGKLPVTDVYDSFIKAMKVRGGYYEEKWASPSENGYQDSLYVFAYDWRLDNVDNARLLVRKVEALRQKLGKPDLKFDIVSHSMGGMIARYAAMYGDSDLPEGAVSPRPNWAGAKLFDRIIMMGTPGGGSMSTLSGFVDGFTIGGLGIELPFLQDTSKFTIFTVPSAYQLLPSPGSFRAFDDRQRPLPIDIYDPKVWTEYGWNPVDDREFAKEFNTVSRADAMAFFEGNLRRARKLHEALEADGNGSDEVEFHVIGSDCRTALDAVVIYRDAKLNIWKTMFDAKEFVGSEGKKVASSDIRKLMFAQGDGVVSDRSLKTIKGGRSERMICGDHNRLAANKKVQEYIIGLLDKPVVSR